MVLNKVVERWGWNASFLCCAGLFLLSRVTALGIDSTSKLFPNNASEDENLPE